MKKRFCKNSKENTDMICAVRRTIPFKKKITFEEKQCRENRKVFDVHVVINLFNRKGSDHQDIEVQKKI